MDCLQPIARRRVVSLILLCAALVMFQPVAQMFVLTGRSWAIKQVPYYVNPANLDVPESEADSAIRTGADAWGLQSNAGVALYYAGRTSGSSLINNGKNEVFFRNATSANGYVAETYWWTDASGRIVDADIVFYDAAYRFATTSTGCSGAAYIEDFATHEFGHVLGLGHSAAGDATMYYATGYCDQTWRTLSADDVAGIEAQYPPAGSIQPPAAPTNLAVVPRASNASSSADVSWVDGSANEDSFLIERSADGGGSFFQTAAVGSNVTSFVDSGLTPSTTYAYRVRASNAGGFSGYTNLASVTTAAPVAPSTPGSPGPSNGATGVAVDADLAWSCTNASSYDVYYGTSASPALYASNITSRALALPRMTAGTTYFWRVVAKNGSLMINGPTWSFTTKTTSRKKR